MLHTVLVVPFLHFRYGSLSTLQSKEGGPILPMRGSRLLQPDSFAAL